MTREKGKNWNALKVREKKAVFQSDFTDWLINMQKIFGMFL